ncbi:hypothetical protein D3C71_1911990 [compost metagenome]
MEPFEEHRAVARAALARRDVLRHAIDIHRGVGAMRALGREAAHAKAVAGLALVDVVGQHARHAAEHVGDIAADIGAGDVLLVELLHGGGQGLGGQRDGRAFAGRARGRARGFAHFD